METQWQTQRVIDHLLFPELFRELLRSVQVCGGTINRGEDYVITESGVRRANESTGEAEDEDAFVQEMRNMWGMDTPEIATYVRERIRPAMLELPCSPAQALEWVMRDEARRDHAPEWLREALAQPDVARALAVVEAAELVPYEEATWEVASVRIAAEALRVIEGLMPAPAAVSPSGPRTAADFSRRGTDTLHAKVRACRDALIAEYQAGDFKSKKAAAEALAEKHGFTFETARNHLKGIPKSP
ncbi:MAG: hypothetical protein QM581_06330 [Pseudomonas sp.]